jgi:hypothetical protein
MEAGKTHTSLHSSIQDLLQLSASAFLRVAVEHLPVHVEPVAPAGQLVEVTLLITLFVVVELIRKFNIPQS